eukprot:745620-Hanusia_phi.AAC.2
MAPKRFNALVMLVLSTMMLAHAASLSHSTAMSPSAGRLHGLSPLTVSTPSCFVSPGISQYPTFGSRSLAACRVPLALPLRSFGVSTRIRGLPDSVLSHINQKPRFLRSPLVLQQTGKDSDTADMEDEEEVEVVVKDIKTGKSIDCYVDEEVVVDGQEYALVYPCDTPVGDFLDTEVSPVISMQCWRMSIRIQTGKSWFLSMMMTFPNSFQEHTRLVPSKTSSSLTLLWSAGDIGDEEEDLDDLGEAVGSEGEDEEFVKVITSYEEKGVEYLVTEPLEPVLIIAKPGVVRESRSSHKWKFSRRSSKGQEEDILHSAGGEVMEE